MIRLILSAIFGCLLLVFPAFAQAPPAPPQAPPQTAATASPIPPDQARQVLEVLNDPKKRAELIATLDAIIKLRRPGAASPATPAAAAAAAPAASQPNSETADSGAEPAAAATGGQPVNNLGADMLTEMTRFARYLGTEIVAGLQAISSVPVLWGWVVFITTDPTNQTILVDVSWRLALVLAAGLVVQFLLSRALRRPREALARLAPTNGTNHAATEDYDGEARAERGEIEAPRRLRHAAWTLLVRLPLALGRFVIDLIPVVAFAVVAHTIATSEWGGGDVSRAICTNVINSYVIYASLVCVSEMLFSPTHPQLRLFYCTNGLASYAMLWIRRLVAIGLIAPTIAEVGSVLGMSGSAQEGLLKGGAFVDNLLLVIIVLQQRANVARWIAAPKDAHGFVPTLRNRLAGIWHWIALLLLAVLWVASVIEVQHGFSRIMHYVGLTIAVLLIGRLLVILGFGLVERLMRIGTAASVQYPGIDARLRMYRGFMLASVRFLIFLLGAIVLLQLWGFGALDWLFGSRSGQQLGSAILSLVITVLLAVLVWEAVHAAIERHLARLTREAQGPRSARLRTLLPLLRTSLLITIVTVVGLMVLSEIGVNIGPLLAGAGIVGVAIGFGSQKLVQDLITGIFLLLENAMQVGDIVTVSGLSGTVENLSVRTIRLRASDGSVHIIPFSSVTSVTNVNRGLGNASVNVTVAFREDTDRVGQMLREIVAEMRRDPDFSSRILSDLQLWGVDKVDGSAVTILGQVVCTDYGRWSVQREFNRRMKRRFQEQGIEIYNPTQSIAVQIAPLPEGKTT